MGGPEFTCAGKVVAISKLLNTPIFSYDVNYKIFMDEGTVGLDKKKISRTNISIL
jgi:hypothetical protein